MATKASPERRPSGLVVALAFTVAIGAAIALIALSVVLRTTGDETAPTPTPVVDFDGIPQEGTVLGTPDARVTLIEYADLQCLACRAYAETYLTDIVDGYIRPGRVKSEFRGIAFIGADSETALRWALAAGLQDRLWQLQEALYRNQGGANSGWVTESLLRRLAADIPGLDADRVLADAPGEDVTAMMAEAERQADAAEVSGTPTLAIGIGGTEPYVLATGLSLDELKAALDDALRR